MTNIEKQIISAILSGADTLCVNFDEMVDTAELGHVRAITPKMWERITDTLDCEGIPFLYDGYPVTDDKAVYSVWVDATYRYGCSPRYSWGLYRVTD